MISNKIVLLSFVILHQFFIAHANTNDVDFESLWSSEEGNSQNTYRIVPSIATHYSKMPWIYEYNLTTQDKTYRSLAAGINGDLYFFLSKSKGHQGKYFVAFKFTKTIDSFS